jgi:hypothetical protein
MATSLWHRVFKPKSPPAVRSHRSATVRLRVEELEARLQPPNRPIQLSRPLTRQDYEVGEGAAEAGPSP